MVMIEVLTGNPRRRRWCAEQKKAMVLEAEQPGMSISPVAGKYELYPNELFHEGALTAMRTDEELVPISEVSDLRNQIREVERSLDRKTIENEILKQPLVLGGLRDRLLEQGASASSLQPGLL